MTTDDALSTKTAPPATARRRLELLVGGAAFVAYARSLTFGFIYDDTTVIRSNPQIQNWSAVLHAFAQPYWGTDRAISGLYRPLFVSTLGVLWNATNHAPLWFHLFAVLLHVAASVAVFRLAARAAGNSAAAIGALWFAVQPVHVEAIASVANTSEIIVALLALGLGSMAGRAASTNAREPLSWGWSVVAALVFGAACLVKESGVMIPALALSFAMLWRRPPMDWPRTRTEFALSRWWRVIVAMAIMLAMVTLARVAVLGTLVPATIAAPGLLGLTFAQRAWSMLALGPVAMRVLLIPEALNPHYGPTYITGATGPSWDAVATIVVLLAAIAIGVSLAIKGDSRFAAGIAWLVLAFVPASNVLSATGQIFAERTLYVSTVGSAFVLAWLVDRVQQWASRFSRRRAIELVAASLAALALGLALGRTWAAVLPWRSHTTLFAQMITADPDSYRGRWLIGLDQRSRNQIDSASASLARAYAMFPNDRQLVIDFAETLRTQERHRDAATVASRLMRWPELRRNDDALSLYLDEVGRAFGADSVRVVSDRLLEGAPSAAAARFAGDARLVLGDSAGAKKIFQRGVTIAPGDTALARRLASLR